MQVVSREEGRVATQYVVTNFRLDEAFWLLCAGKMMCQEPFSLECEEVFGDGPVVRMRRELVVEQMSNAFGVFSCLGHTDGRSFRLEDELGTLYLTIV
jgi:hypothetical protein